MNPPENPVRTPVMTPDQIARARQRPTVYQHWPPGEFPLKIDRDSSESMMVAVSLTDGQRTDGFYDDRQACWYLNDLPTGHVLAVANSEIDFWHY